MQKDSLLAYRKNINSQNGEDGIIAEIFRRLSIVTGTCCEFGAWDGIHLSNCRSLVESGWSAVMIEGDPERYKDLLKTYQDNPKVHSVNAFVDTGSNSLDHIVDDTGVGELDFLSVDIDGLDYDICVSLKMRPKVICVEVNAGHSPLATHVVDREVARHNVGQPLGVFTSWAADAGYSLVCYSGNAFYVRTDLLKESNIQSVSDIDAYQDFLSGLTTEERTWMWLVGLGLVTPHYYYNNSFISRRKLQLPVGACVTGIRRWGCKRNGIVGVLVRLLKGFRLHLRREQSSLYW